MSNIKYRPEVDGLRAVAVLPVLFFHAAFPGFSGGFLGVDVFFVISGYLITSIILRDIEDRGFSFARFYERRARRILPALTLVMLACVPVAWMLMTPRDLEQFGGSIVATVTFLSNVFFYYKTDYFGRAAEYLPLIHTWSLAIEEQFYLIFPVVMIFLAKFAKKAMLPVFIVVFVLSLAAAQIGTTMNASASFFLLPFRAWELTAGAIIAYNEIYKGPAQSKYSPLLTLLGLLMIVGSIPVFNFETHHPGLPTLVPIVGTMLVIAHGRNGGVASQFLSWKPVVFIGLISYSLYLWHQPIFVFYRLGTVGEPSMGAYLVLMAISIVIASLAWKYVETPFRSAKVVPTRWIWTSAALGMAGCLAIGLALHFGNGIPSRLPKDLRAMIQATNNRGGTRLTINGKGCHERPIDNPCVIGNAAKPPTWALIGDSHAASFSKLFEENLTEAGESGVQFTHGACGYGDGVLKYGAGSPNQCSKFSQEVREALQRLNIKNVIITGRYPYYVNNSRYDNEEGGIEAGNLPMRFEPKGKKLTGQERMDKMVDIYKSSIQELVDSGIRVVLIYPIVEVGWDVPTETYKRDKLGMGRSVTSSYDRWVERSHLIREGFDAIPDSPNLVRVYPEQILCEQTKGGRCKTANEEGLLYYDSHHLSKIGAKLVLDDTLRNLMGLPIR
ncbi:MAG: acyltransferase family protein [Fimbriimonadaceae bacterium]